ncbi:MAG: DUF1307 domain-containing protein [Bacilli bacterium]|nr:DUF1307 domain-containing protein [Bacilli bacterium]
MKKRLSLVLAIFIITLCLCGCKEKTKISNCSLVSDQSASGYKLESNYKIYSTNNFVDKVVLKQVINSKDKKVLDSFKTSITNQYKNNNKLYNGYTFDIKEKDNKLNINVTIDYTKVDLKKFTQDNVSMKEYVNKDYKITLDKIIKLYESSGMKCEK